MKSDLFVGIDLGTSHSSIAYLTDDPRVREMAMLPVKVMELPLEDREATRSVRMPSIASRDLDDRRVRRPLLGWKFFETFDRPRRRSRLLRREVDLFTSAKSDMGTYRVYPDAFSEQLNTPVKVSAQILRSLIDIACQRLGREVARARITLTVPASFSVLARDDTLRAARLAGLDRERVELIDEPVAALLDLLNDVDAATVLTKEDRTILVFDYGGGTCDLALVRARFQRTARTGIHVENLAISEYRRLGGDDIDREIMAQVVWPQICDPGVLDPETRRQIEDTLTVTVCRRLKEELCRKVSEVTKRGGGKEWARLCVRPVAVDVSIERRFLIDASDVAIPGRFEIRSDQFEALMAPFLAIESRSTREARSRSLVMPILETLRRAGLNPSDLDVLVLHGASCRNPYVGRMLREVVARSGDLFGEVRVVETPDLDASVAKGAALSGYWRHARGTEIVAPIIAEDLGIVARGESPVRLVSAGTPLPYPEAGMAEVERELYVARAQQRELLVPVYVGQAPRLAGSVRVPLAQDIEQGAAVRIKLAVDRDKRLHWWFSIQGGPYEEAPSVNDPWTADVQLPERARVLAHRRAIRDLVEAGGRPSVEMEYREAQLLYEAGAFEEALHAIERLVRRDGRDARSLNLQGVILGALGRHAEAAIAHQHAAEIHPDDPIYRGNYGCELFRLGRTSEAIAAMREALGRNQELTYLYEWLGGVYRRLGDEEAAVREYRRGLMLAVAETQRYPAWPEAWRRRVSLHRAVGEYEAADDSARQLEKIRRDERYGGDTDDLVTTL